MAYSSKYNAQSTVSGPSLNPGSDLNILIVGKIGAGKSATAKSILEEECVKRGSLGVLQKTIDGRELLVVDVPGPSDSELLDPQRCREKADKNMRLATCLSPEGYHAILIVFRYDQRLTKGGMREIEEIKQILGEDFMRDHGVLLISGGDQIEDTLNRNEILERWCKDQEGYMKDLLHSCQNRCLLFNNRDKNGWKQQRFDLVQIIDRMGKGKRYKRDIFEVFEEKYRDTEDISHSGNRSGNLLQAIISWRPWSIMSWLIMAPVRWFLPTPQLKNCKSLLVNEMRDKLEELKCVSAGLRGRVKRKLDENIQNAECKLIKMDELAANP